MEGTSEAKEVLAYTPASLARAIGLGETKVREILANQEIRSFTVGRRILIPKVEVARWMQRQLGDAADAA